jgi:hypothetical protein
VTVSKSDRETTVTYSIDVPHSRLPATTVYVRSSPFNPLPLREIRRGHPSASRSWCEPSRSFGCACKGRLTKWNTTLDGGDDHGVSLVMHFRLMVMRCAIVLAEGTVQARCAVRNLSAQHLIVLGSFRQNEKPTIQSVSLRGL